VYRHQSYSLHLPQVWDWFRLSGFSVSIKQQCKLGLATRRLCQRVGLLVSRVTYMHCTGHCATSDEVNLNIMWLFPLFGLKHWWLLYCLCSMSRCIGPQADTVFLFFVLVTSLHDIIKCIRWLYIVYVIVQFRLNCDLCSLHLPVHWCYVCFVLLITAITALQYCSTNPSRFRLASDVSSTRYDRYAELFRWWR
jgi:hypothetical protein